MVTTNGWFVTPDRAREIFRAGLLGASISLDYIDPKKHDKQRGQEGAFKRAVQALQYLSEARTQKHQRVAIITVLHEGNIDDLEPLIQLAARYNTLFMTQPYSAMKTGNKSFLAQKKVSNYLISLKKKYNNFVSNPGFLSKFDEYFQHGIDGCRAGRAFFNIDNFCNVAICVEERYHPVGNLITDPVLDIFAAMRRESKRNSCRSCWYNCRGEIEVLYTLNGLRYFIPAVFSVITSSDQQ
jgi:MoaA/NifB/PqqE/SkfB family radical SAM enzyme